MTQPLSRDELARHLYVHDGLKPERVEHAYEWDAGLVTDEDVRDCYARADQQLAEEANR